MPCWPQLRPSHSTTTYDFMTFAATPGLPRRFASLGYELLLTENCVINFEYRAAGVAEYEFDSFFLQAANYDLRARYLHFCLFVFQVIFVP